jgi:Predicted esterase
MTVHTVPATTTGRYLVAPTDAASKSILFGFHGYGQNAEENLEEISRIAGRETRILVAIQALHWFYRPRSEAVIASWMTRVGRDEAIANNLAYVRNVVDRVRAGRRDVPFFFAGFAQGAAMAWRAAAAIAGAAGLIILGGDFPPEITTTGALPSILLGRGNGDEWYTDDKMQRDLERLHGARVESCVFDGGHEWGAAFLERAAAFLAARE